jgi:hypothetical protein
LSIIANSGTAVCYADWRWDHRPMSGLGHAWSLAARELFATPKVSSGSMLSKKDFGDFPSNIDSRGKPITQHRFKTMAVLIRSLRPGRVPRTSSTASVNSTSPEAGALLPLAAVVRAASEHFSEVPGAELDLSVQ